MRYEKVLYIIYWMQLYEVQTRFIYDEIKSTISIKKSYTLLEYKIKSKIVVYDSVYVAIHNVY